MKRILYLLFALTFTLTACEDDKEDVYVLQREDIIIIAPEGGYVTEIGKVFELKVKSVSDEGVTYKWWLGTNLISSSKNLQYIFKKGGQQIVTLSVSQGKDLTFRYNVSVDVKGQEKPQEKHSPYIAKVLDYRPAVGQFVNNMPEYVLGDTQEDMNRKALDAIGNNNLGMITLGGYGGYIIFGFDHTVENVEGKRDFRIMGNALQSDNIQDKGGSSEPGIVMVSYDANKNGLADDEWYEIAGSAHRNPTGEAWFEKAKAAGNDVKLYRNYEITYHRPDLEPKEEKDFGTYIRWEDNQGKSGFKTKNAYHKQSYFPQWLNEDKITFQGTCLPQNTVDQSGEGNYFVSYAFSFGYVDNDLNESIGSTFDIDWAVNTEGKKVNLKGIDFIKVYTGVNQENGWIGECSTEISGAEDLHILGESIDSPEI